MTPRFRQDKWKWYPTTLPDAWVAPKALGKMGDSMICLFFYDSKTFLWHTDLDREVLVILVDINNLTPRLACNAMDKWIKTKMFYPESRTEQYESN